MIILCLADSQLTSKSFRHWLFIIFRIRTLKHWRLFIYFECNNIHFFNLFGLFELSNYSDLSRILWIFGLFQERSHKSLFIVLQALFGTIFVLINCFKQFCINSHKLTNSCYLCFPWKKNLFVIFMDFICKSLYFSFLFILQNVKLAKFDVCRRLDLIFNNSRRKKITWRYNGVFRVRKFGYFIREKLY